MTSYTNWSRAKDYPFSHADDCKYRKTSYNKCDAFLDSQNNLSIRIDQRITKSASKTVKRNRQFLKSVLRSLEYLERQGLVIQGRRDDGTVLGDNGII